MITEKRQFTSGRLETVDLPISLLFQPSRRIDTLQLDDQELGLRGRFLQRSVFLGPQ